MTVKHTATFVTTATAAALLTVLLSACGSPQSDSSVQEHDCQDVISPVIIGVNQLQDAEVDLLVQQTLVVDTESLDVDSYSAQVSDPSVAEFTPGYSDGSAIFNPGFTGLSPGSVDVLMVNEQGGIQPLEFSIKVSAE